MILITLAWIGIAAYMTILGTVWVIAGKRPLSLSDRKLLTILAHFIPPPDPDMGIGRSGNPTAEQDSPQEPGGASRRTDESQRKVRAAAQ
jgi:hypothetical protein